MEAQTQAQQQCSICYFSSCDGLGAGLLAAQPAVNLFPNGFQAALMEAQAQAAQQQPPLQLQQAMPPPPTDGTTPMQASGAETSPAFSPRAASSRPKKPGMCTSCN